MGAQQLHPRHSLLGVAAQEPSGLSTAGEASGNVPVVPLAWALGCLLSGWPGPHSQPLCVSPVCSK